MTSTHSQLWFSVRTGPLGGSGRAPVSRRRRDGGNDRALTFSVTPRMLMASLKREWCVCWASSSQIHTPRLQTATHLKETGVTRCAATRPG